MYTVKNVSIKAVIKDIESSFIEKEQVIIIYLKFKLKS